MSLPTPVAENETTELASEPRLDINPSTSIVPVAWTTISGSIISMASVSETETPPMRTFPSMFKSRD